MQRSYSQGRTVRVFTWIAVIALTFSYLIAAIMYKPQTANAAAIGTRSITMGTTEENASNVSYTVSFVVPSSTVGAFRITFCDNNPLPNTTCTFNAAGDDVPDLTGAANADAALSGATGCTVISETAGSNYIDFTCNATEADGGTFTATITGIENPSNATDSPTDPNNSFYARLYSFSDTSPTAYNNDESTYTDDNNQGGVALSTAEQLTITARVQEILEFCVGTDSAAPANCTDMTGNSVDLGVLDFANINYSTTQAVPTQGSLFLRTNASNGAAVVYFAEEAGAGGTDHVGSLRVNGADCANEPGNSAVDQCINSIGTAQTQMVSATENFGMCAFGIDTSSGTTTNVSLDAAYNGLCDNSDANNGFAWDESGSTDTIATSNTVVHDEMIELTFAGTSAVTTPTGSYSVVATFIGTATF